MLELSAGLVMASFVAGVLMFIAPCTLPLVPAYLAFIAGVKPAEVSSAAVRQKIVRNSLLYSAGFTLVFVGFGILAGLLGSVAGSLRSVLIPLSGLLVIMFGLQMLHVVNLSRFFSSQSVSIPLFLKPGSATGAFVIGAAFALGWTPCIGPVLATVLLLAGSLGTVMSGALLLFVFSLGLALPFLLVALLYARATHYIATHQRFLYVTEVLGGLLLVGIGLLLLTNNFDLTIYYGTQALEFFGLGQLLDYY